MKNKNIYLIPTDKPSRLCIDNSCDELNCSEVEGLNSKHITNQNIYITSDEEIKEGDWVYCRTENRVLISNVSYSKLDDRFKIILTTDQDLIKDGVQAIDDEFLEWFVKNPSCEEVEVDCWTIRTKDKVVYEPPLKDYKIIIPQEEPKFEELKFKNRQMGGAGFVANKIMENMISKFKQETLEEALSEHIKDIKYPTLIQCAEFGAKWQQERSYSEEEVRKIAEEVRWQAIGNPLEFTKNFEKWFEKFKKK
jgi:hypothetical protein